MQPTRRFWTVVALAFLLAALAALFDQPVILLGSGAIAVLLLVSQWTFLAHTRALDEGLAVDVTLSRTYAQQDESVQATLTVERDWTGADVSVTVPVPLAASGEGDLTVRLPAGDDAGTATTQVAFPVAGVASFDRPTVTIPSRDGLFVQTLQRGPSPSVTVEPRQPDDVHVGEGGERTDASFGAHRAGRTGTGIDPAELREYTPGDDVGDIDWKATARQTDLYVREYEVETDQRTVLLFDHRHALAAGQPGERMCDYLREVALVFATTAQEFSDPLGLYAIGDHGLTAEFSPSTDADQYRAIRQHLHDAEPTTGTQRVPSVGVGPARAGAKATALAGDDSTAATTLRPFFSAGAQYIHRIEGEPLFDVARTYVSPLQGGVQTLVFTDDTNRVQLRETVRVARGGAGQVLVFLTPSVLFEEDSMTDLEETYDRYLEFESFRRELAGLDRVSAFEVAPGDRIQAVLDSGKQGEYS